MKFTEEQEQIIQMASGRSGSAMIQAGAGCAKTSTGKAAMGKIKSPGLALAFNKKISDDLAKAMPPSFTSKSFNGLGHGAWAKAIGIRPQLEERKLGKLVSEIAKSWKLELSTDQWDGLRKMVTGAMGLGLVPSSDPYYHNTLVEDTPQNWITIGMGLGLGQDDAELLAEAARKILTLDIEQARAGVITFDDQVYCSTMLGGQFPKFPVVFVDEAQDLSPLNIKMVGMASGPNARHFIVGDRKQAIYAWRGASGTSMDDIIAIGQNWQHFPLLTTFRCPKLVVERQQFHVPGFRAWHTNPDGNVERLGIGEDASWTFDDIIRAGPGPGTEIAILCRNNSPLIALAMKLLRKGIGCFMLGRDIGKNLITLSKKLAPDNGTPRDQVIGKVLDWKIQEISLCQATGRESLIDGITDRAEGLLALMEGAECTDAGALRAVLGRIFARDSGQVCLSSIHRAKGLEWDLVVHLDPWRVPGKRAKVSGGIELEQEYNLKYVCETRTKHTLLLANLDNFVGD